MHDNRNEYTSVSKYWLTGYKWGPLRAAYVSQTWLSILDYGHRVEIMRVWRQYNNTKWHMIKHRNLAVTLQRSFMATLNIVLIQILMRASHTCTIIIIIWLDVSTVTDITIELCIKKNPMFPLTCLNRWALYDIAILWQIP